METLENALEVSSISGWDEGRSLCESHTHRFDAYFCPFEFCCVVKCLADVQAYARPSVPILLLADLDTSTQTDIRVISGMVA